MSRRFLLYMSSAVIALVSASFPVHPQTTGKTYPERLRRADSFLGIHFDFHAGYDCTEVGKNVTPEMIERIIDLMHPDYIQCDCKGHAGISSYPTKVGYPAPGFVRDQLRIWRDVTARRGVALYMHYSGVWDNEAVKHHPDWARVDEKGAIDTRLTYGDIPMVLIDTAGIRRRGHITPGVEQYSVLRALQAIERSDVVLLILDATAGLTAQDAHIAGFILDAWKSAVVLVNKWDAVEKDTYTMAEFTESIRQELNFMDYVPVLFISAKTGQRVDQVLPLALRVQEERLTRLPTSKINRILQQAQDQHAAPSHAGTGLKIYYGTQVRNDPPVFLLHVNDPKLAHFTYLRYVENCIRKEHAFMGTPIRIVLRPRRK